MPGRFFSGTPAGAGPPTVSRIQPKIGQKSVEIRRTTARLPSVGRSSSEPLGARLRVGGYLRNFSGRRDSRPPVWCRWAQNSSEPLRICRPSAPQNRRGFRPLPERPFRVQGGRIPRNVASRSWGGFPVPQSLSEAFGISRNLSGIPSDRTPPPREDFPVALGDTPPGPFRIPGLQSRVLGRNLSGLWGIPPSPLRPVRLSRLFLLSGQVSG